MKLIKLFLFCLFLTSCSTKDKQNQKQISCISTCYNSQAAQKCKLNFDPIACDKQTSCLLQCNQNK